MIAQRFKPIIWVAGAAFAATGLYIISSQVANAHQKLDEINHKILVAQHDIRLLQTELSTRASLRRLEKYNGETLALSAPRAVQYLASANDLQHFDVASLNRQPIAPVALAQVKADYNAQSKTARPDTSEGQKYDIKLALSPSHKPHTKPQSTNVALLEPIFGQRGHQAIQ